MNSEVTTIKSQSSESRLGSMALTLNAGSSSLRFALFRIETSPVRVLSGVIERIGLPSSILSLSASSGCLVQNKQGKVASHTAALQIILPFINDALEGNELCAVGHRIVHGGERYSQANVVSPEMLRGLEQLTAFAPEHLPAELELVSTIMSRLPGLPQVACFDTAFHRDPPPVARTLPIPHCYAAAGVRRYGFHGLSYEFLLEELSRLGVSAATKGRVVLAHLGNGCSMAAVRDGICIDTSMSFTPAAGLMMGRRCGDLDPGLFAYLSRAEGKTRELFNRIINHESGLLGVSEISPDIRELLACEQSDIRAAESIALFCYIAKKWIGAFASALGGIDTLVFSGGIGENAAAIRARICAGLGFLGIVIDDDLNSANASVVSNGGTSVRVIRTDEELMIARSICRLIKMNETEHRVYSDGIHLTVGPR